MTSPCWRFITKCKATGKIFSCYLARTRARAKCELHVDDLIRLLFPVTWPLLFEEGLGGF
ncbi:MAG: hypothetical protein A2Z14_16605 [Chloroflexi bacterium RBG_16_48_8]|nr:MAG: hypothetical protein A2Z14_16605 [Chloroflexi bacterium RBG_16_48_8]